MKPSPLVLVVDDDSAIRLILRRLIEHLCPGVTVQLAADGLAALTLCQQTLPALIITDLMMPEMDGFALIAALQAEGIRAPVIVVAANATQQARALQAGANAFISKGELLTALPAVLKQFVPQAA